MERNKPLLEFQGEWEEFLGERGHKVSSPRGIGCVLRSLDPAGRGYRWLLLSAPGKSRTLSPAERQDVRHHLARAEKLRQGAYVVIRFRKPETKVIVLPAATALERSRILPAKGGIPWVD